MGEGGAAGDGGGGGYDSQANGDLGTQQCVVNDASVAGGGGGAQGRIRINTITAYTPSGAVSPTPTTPAYSTGPLREKPLP